MTINDELIRILVGSVKHKGDQPLTTQYLLNLLKQAEQRAAQRQESTACLSKKPVSRISKNTAPSDSSFAQGST
jgi:hypothetical protein